MTDVQYVYLEVCDLVHEIICPPARRTGSQTLRPQPGSAPFLSLNKAELGIAPYLLNSVQSLQQAVPKFLRS